MWNVRSIIRKEKELKEVFEQAGLDVKIVTKIKKRWKRV